MDTFIIDSEFRSLIPPLAKEELDELEKSIMEKGCLDSLKIWKGFNILVDGHHRYNICERHNKSYKVEELEFADRTEAKIWIIKNQFGRRNLTPYTRSILVLKLKPLIAAKAKANIIHGVEKKPPQNSAELTISKSEYIETRQELASLAGVSHDTITKAEIIQQKGSDELQEAANKGEISINAASSIAELPKDEQAKVLKDGKPEIQKAARALKRQKAKQRKAERARAKEVAVKKNHPLQGESYKLIVGDLIEASSDIVDGSIDAIITDPPYSEESIPLYGKLCRLAERVLRPGGHLVVMTGQANLPTVLAEMNKYNLIYQWTLAYFTPGQSTQCFGRKVKSNWKPILWFTKGRNTWEHIEDVIKSDANDKRFHEWGQSVGGMAQLIERFTVPKSLILDPFCGAGTTGIASLKLGRLIILIDKDSTCIHQSATRLSEAI